MSDARNDTFFADEDRALAGDVLADNGQGRDSAAGGGLLVVTHVNGTPITPGAAIVLASGAVLRMGSDGRFGYDPAGVFDGLGAGETGLDGFGYTVSDGKGGTDTAVVTLLVNGLDDSAVARDDVFGLGEDGVLSGDLLADNGHGADAGGGALRVVAVNGGAIGAGATAVLESGALLTVQADGTFSYDPGAAFQGLGAGEVAQDGFGYALSDGGPGTDTGRVTITVAGENDAPVVTVSDVVLDADARVALSDLAAVSDAEGDTAVLYQLRDSAGSDSAWAAGGFVDARDGHGFSDLSSIWLVADDAASDQTLYLRAHDGTDWGDWAAFTLTTRADAGPEAGLGWHYGWYFDAPGWSPVFGWHVDWTWAAVAAWSWGWHIDWTWGWVRAGGRWEKGWSWAWDFGWSWRWDDGWSWAWDFGWSLGWSTGWSWAWALDWHWAYLATPGWLAGPYFGWDRGGYGISWDYMHWAGLA